MDRDHELRSHTAQMDLDIFGRNVGWVLYRNVRLETLPVSGRFCLAAETLSLAILIHWKSRNGCDDDVQCSMTHEMIGQIWDVVDVVLVIHFPQFEHALDLSKHKAN